MFSRMLKNIDGFLRFKKIESHSRLEKLGDFFLKPVRIVFNGRDIEVIADHKNAVSYSYTGDVMDYHPNRMTRRKRASYLLLLPFALIGIPIKAAGLIFHENRQHLARWEPPLKILNDDRVSETWWKLGVRPRQQLLNELNKKGLMRILIERHLKNPDKYLSNIRIPDNANEYIASLLKIGECGCIDNSHDRHFSDMRFILKNLIVNQSEKSYEENKEVNVLSFGSGEGLQDFIIVYMLLCSKIYKINLTMVETGHRVFSQKIIDEGHFDHEFKHYGLHSVVSSVENKRNNVVGALSMLSRAYTPLRLNLKSYSDIHRMLLENDSSSKGKFDVIYGIDIDSYTPDSRAKKDFHLAIDTLLKPSGLGLLSYHTSLFKFKHSAESKEMKVEEEKVEVRTLPQFPLRLI